ncbi:hypothetical protein OKW38_007371 [Paraburkholderia sp. MM5496-R1]
MQLLRAHEFDGDFVMTFERHREPREMGLLGEAAAYRHEVDRAEQLAERPAERASQSQRGVVRRQRHFHVIDGVQRVMQRAARELGAPGERLREAARERTERRQQTMQLRAAALRRMHAADQFDHPVQLVVGRGGEPDQARAVTQRMEQQQ